MKSGGGGGDGGGEMDCPLEQGLKRNGRRLDDRNVKSEYQRRTHPIKYKSSDKYPLKCKPPRTRSTVIKQSPSRFSSANKEVLNQFSVSDNKRDLKLKCGMVVENADSNEFDGLLKDSFRLRQCRSDSRSSSSRAIGNNNNSYKNSSSQYDKGNIDYNNHKETTTDDAGYCDKGHEKSWQVFQNTCLLRPICDASTANSNSKIAESKIVKPLGKKGDMKTIDTKWKNPIIGKNKYAGIPSLALTKSQAKLHKVDKLFSQCSFSTDMLAAARVIGPVDCKFIACVMRSNDMDDMLVLIDQHAAHERIRLERLIERIDYHRKIVDVVSNEFTRLVPPAQLVLFDRERELLSHYKKEFNSIGFNFSVCDGKNSHCVVVHSVPSIFVDGHSRQVEANCSSVNTEFLKEFIVEQGNFMQMTGSTCTMSSRTVFKALASYACHGAIRFGDKISLSVCEEIVRDLAKCNLPFQCAHGRPSIAPLIKLTFLDGIVKLSAGKPNLSKLKKS